MNSLLLASTFDPDEHDACTRLLVGDTHRVPVAAANRHRLHVLFDTSPADRLRRVRQSVPDTPPGHAAIVSAGYHSDRRFASADGRTGDACTNPAVTTVSGPADLSGIEIAIERYLDAWSCADESIRVCVDSLTVLIQYVGLSSAVQFLHRLQAHLAPTDSSVHVHLAVDAHEPHVVRQIARLFDEVVETDEHHLTGATPTSPQRDPITHGD